MPYKQKEDARRYQREWKRKRRALGISEETRLKNLKTQRKKYHYYKSIGMCVTCGNDSKKFVQCIKCRMKERHARSKDRTKTI